MVTGTPENLRVDLFNYNPSDNGPKIGKLWSTNQKVVGALIDSP